jgi:hypothetical protein
MTTDEITGREERIEVMLDPSAAGWRPGEPCPECGHSVVHAIVRAGVQFRSDGSWEFDETLGVYDAFCPTCDWLPPVRSS